VFSGGNIVSGSGIGPYQINWNTNGAKNITLNVNDNNCVADSAKVLNVSILPIAKFKYSQLGTAITFTNQSSGATAFNWSFGDGNTSTNQHPIHSYSTNGMYVVTLLIQNTNCVDSYKDTIYITNANGIQNPEINKNEDLIVSHNNALSQLTINFITDSNLKNIELYNMQGQLIYTKSNIASNTIIISTSSFASGIYLANFKTSNGNIISKKWNVMR
jgi:PKD repeat protein